MHSSLTSRKNISRLLLCAVVAIAFPAVLLCQQPRVYDFLRFESSARASAMAGSFMTVTNDPAAMFYNPATINTVDSTQVSFTFFKHLLDINSGFSSIVTNIDGIGKVGAGVNFTNYGSFDLTDKNGNVNGTFGASDLQFTTGWAGNLGDGISAGIMGEVIFSKIQAFSSSALALSGGLLYVDTAKRLQIGIAVLHLGSQTSSFGADNEPLPLDLKVGISHELKGLPLLLALNMNRLLDPGDSVHGRFSAFDIGGEFKISNPLRLRFGYNNRIRQDVPSGDSKGLAGLSAGFGVLVKDYRFDYAFNSLSTLGGLHHITVNVIF